MESNSVKKNRESWGSRFGFIMATAGFAIGLGNIWRFPYMVGKNGGGAFLFVYLLICAIICVPLFIGEIGLGRKTQLNPIEGMRKLTKKGSVWVLIGWFGTIASILVMSYYLMIIGWMFAYFFKVIFGQFNGASSEQIALTFKTFTSNPLQVIIYTLIIIGILGTIVTKGLKNGVEKACKIMMPALLIMLIILAIRSLTLPGAMKGLMWYVTPDFSKVNGEVALAALGQAFFSVGIGIACAFTYGSYLDPKKSDLPGDASVVVGLDTLVAVIAGLVIFPALFSFGMSPEAGPGLLFITMPRLFSQLPGGNFFGGMFFFLVVLAGLTSGMGYLETVASTTSELLNISRKKAVWGTLAVMFIMGIPSILSQGPWAHILVFGRNFFDLADYISGNILMTAGALLISLYIAYIWKFENYRKETNVGSGNFKINKWWKPFIMYLIPAAVAIIMIKGIF